MELQFSVSVYTQFPQLPLNTVVCPPDPPEVEVERSTVYTGEGHSVVLVCIVYSDPPAKVSSRVISPLVYTGDSYSLLLVCFVFPCAPA